MHNGHYPQTERERERERKRERERERERERAQIVLSYLHLKFDFSRSTYYHPVKVSTKEDYTGSKSTGSKNVIKQVGSHASCAPNVCVSNPTATFATKISIMSLHKKLEKYQKLLQVTKANLYILLKGHNRNKNYGIILTKEQDK